MKLKKTAKVLLVEDDANLRLVIKDYLEMQGYDIHVSTDGDEGYKAFKSAKINKDEIGCISAHGTGTVYNDSMEMKAFKKVFSNRKVPTYSIKGGTGHTM